MLNHATLLNNETDNTSFTFKLCTCQRPWILSFILLHAESSSWSRWLFLFGEEVLGRVTNNTHKHQILLRAPFLVFERWYVLTLIWGVHVSRSLVLGYPWLPYITFVSSLEFKKYFPSRGLLHSLVLHVVVTYSYKFLAEHLPDARVQLVRINAHAGFK